jgi:SAM-dependent methyltransferase
MQKRYVDRLAYFREQSMVSEKFVLPYIESIMPISEGMMVAEVGCGEGGNLKPFLDRGCRTFGIDLAAGKIENALQFFGEHPLKENLTLVTNNIYHVRPEQIAPLDLIILRDTLEHIPNQGELLWHLKRFLKPGGMIYISFPSWKSPFAGHQQICNNNLLRKLPYFHLLPPRTYATILRLFGEGEAKVKGLLEIRDTRMYYQRFLRYTRKHEYQITKIDFFVLNPSYEVKFKLKARKLAKVLNIPYLRDFLSTTCYCLLGS